MNRVVSILMLGGAKRVSIGRKLVEAGKRLGFEVQIFGFELSENVPLAAIAEKIFAGSKFIDPKVYDEINTVVRDRSIDIIIPFIDPAIEVAAKYTSEINPSVFAPVSDENVSLTTFDKRSAQSLYSSVGLPLPVCFDNIEVKDIVFPVIAKPRYGSASKGLKILESANDFQNAEISRDDYLLQEYIADRQEITVDCYVNCHSGEIQTISPRVRLETAGGEAVSTLTIDSPEAVELARQTISLCGLKGAVTVQLIRDNISGRLMVMEVNSRLGGGVVASVCAGANIPELLLADALNLEVAPTKARPDTLVKRYLEEISFQL